MSKKELKNVWGSAKYLRTARSGSLDVRHPGMVILKKLAFGAKNILDLGCGEGTRLKFLTDEGKVKGTGIDISVKAIKKAKNNYKKLKFIKGNLEKLPFNNDHFDLVYSAYVLEHLENPEKVISESIRVLKVGGHLVFISPNFGAPNRASPPFEGSRITKLLKGLINDIFVMGSKNLNWNKVTPIASLKKYEIDWDTTTEPYLLSLIRFLINRGLKIVSYNSCWVEELPDTKPIQKLFSFFGKLKVFPFSMWGPHLVVVCQKIVQK